MEGLILLVDFLVSVHEKMGQSNDIEADAFSEGSRQQDRELDDSVNSVDADHLTHLQFLQSMERVNRAIHQADDLEQMLKDTLDTVLDIFDVDRVFLLYPCDPDAESFSAPMESTRSGYPGACEMGFEPDTVSCLQSICRELQDVNCPISFGSGSERPIPPELIKWFAIKSVLGMPIFPKVGPPWLFGMHQCSRERKWTEEIRQLFQEIGRRIADALSSYLTLRDLRESERRYRTLVENIPSAVYQCDIHNGWEISFFSGQIQQITGYPPSHFVGCSMQRYYDLVHPDDLDGFKHVLQERVSQNKQIDLEYRIKTSNGEQRWVYSRGQPIYDELGRPCRLDGVINDITKRKIAEEAMRASEEKYRSFFKWSADPMVMLDGDRFADCNDAVVSMFGLESREELLKLCPWELSPDCQPDGMSSREKASELLALLPRKRSLCFEWLHKRADGELFPSEVTLTDIRVGEKKLVHGVIRDITALKQAEEAMRQSEEKYRTLFQWSAEPMFLLEGDVIIDCNEATVQMYGYGDKDSMLNKHPWDLSPEFQPDGTSSREKALEIVSELPDKRSMRFEWLHKSQKGDLFPAEIVLTYIKVGNKHLAHASARDISELKLAEKAVRESEEKYRSLFEWSADPMLLIEGDTFVDCNDAAVRMLRCESKKELLQMHPWELSPEFQANGRSSREKAEEIIAAMPKERSRRFEWIHRRADGELFPAEVVLTYIPFGDKHLINTVWRDLTELKQAEKALLESEEKYRSLFEGSADATLLVQGDTFVDCNDAAVHILRCKSKDEILQKHPWDFAPEIQPDGTSSLQKVNDVVARMPQERSMRFEWYHRRADGELFPADILLTYISVGDKPFIYTVWRDLTEWKKAEEEARHLRNLLNNIVNSMPSVLVSVDVDAKVIQWNLMAQKASGISSEEAQGKNLLELFPRYADYLAQVRKSIAEREAILNPKIPIEIEGETRFSDITIYPLITNGIDGAVIRIDDVTDRVQVEEMIVQSEKMLSVGGLAAGMAHEINNPLAGILQSVQVILDRFSPDMTANQKVADEYGINLQAMNDYLHSRKITDLLKGVSDSGRRAARIVGNMLSFSRKSSAEYAHKNLAEIIDRTLELTAGDYVAKRDFQFREIRIEKDYAADLPDVPCEETEIQQVILNLLKNAAHAMVDRAEPHIAPCIKIRTSQDADMAKIEIEDNGPGMSETVRRRVFEPFYTTKSVGVGTGLGLSVSYFIITEKHLGTLSVESTPGKGTKFIIRLPLERKIVTSTER